jgi:hypothetical protein
MGKKIIAVVVAVVLSACSTDTVPDSAPVITSTLPAIAITLAADVVPPVTLLSSSDWQGIPIMPGALAGEGDEDGYVFTIRSAIEQVRAFYEAELPKLGWKSIPTEDASTMMFIRDDEALAISLMAKGDEILVLLTR